MERTEAELIAAVLKGDAASFEPLVERYSPRLFATARRYARRESEVEDIVQEAWLKAYEKLSSYRAEAPFEHWLMRLTVRTCYDFLRAHQRNRETSFSELTDMEGDWLDRYVAGAEPGGVTLLEIEERSIKEISQLTGWSIPLVKVRAFRARAEMRRILSRIAKDKYL